MTKFLNISTDTTLGGSSASDSTVSSQKAIKAYVDSQTGTAPAFANITGQPTDNANLASALNAKYDASNPNGYTSNVGTVTSVNNVSPVNGNVTISIPSEVTESTVSGWGFTKNTGTVTRVNSVSPVNGNVTLSIPAAQVNSDWNAVSGVTQILNKPNLATVATSGSYNDLSNKPTIPTVNNATLTLTQGGTTKGTFTANASSNVTIDLDSGGASRNIGEIIKSTIPLTDAGLHLLDGSLISGSGSYSDFVTYMANLYTTDPTASYFVQPKPVSTFIRPNISSNGTMGVSDFAVDGRNYSTQQMYLAFDGDSTTYWETYNYAKTDTCYIYNSDAIKISKIKINSKDNKGWTSITISGSNDNITYSEKQTVNTSNTTNIDEFNVVFGNFYKYYKIIYTNRYTSNSGYYAQITEFEITATVAGQTPEEVWQQSVNKYGACGKFVYDSVNNTVRLPKITGFTEGTIDPTVLGDLTEAGLPNIEGTIGDRIEASTNPTATGAFYVTTTSGGGEGNGNYKYFGMGIDASLSNPIYGNSLTVQPQSIKVLYYIVIATSTKTSIEVDIDEIATDLNGKADVDLTNTSPSSSFATVLNTSGIRTVVETWHSGSDWYRIWSDGWVEQGGTRVATTTWETITFLKPFANNNYTSLVSNTAGGTSANGIRNKTATTMQIYQNWQYDWYACGY